jgi:hypothetical protein
VDLRERGDGTSGVRVVADLERGGERVLEVLDRLVGVAEQEVDGAEVVQQLADVRAVGDLLVVGLRLLGVRAREHPVPRAVGEQRGLEVEVTRRACVLQALGELERELDILPGGLVVALAAVAP